MPGRPVDQTYVSYILLYGVHACAQVNLKIISYRIRVMDDRF
jgi:hypothetical protein